MQGLREVGRDTMKTGACFHNSAGKDSIEGKEATKEMCVYRTEKDSWSCWRTDFIAYITEDGV